VSSHPQSAGEVRAASLLDMTDQRPTDAEMDELVSELADAGLLTIEYDPEGTERWRLTPDGERVARQLAMSEDPDAVLDALLRIPRQSDHRFHGNPISRSTGFRSPHGEAAAAVT
jgi:hypothetical protein